MCNSKVRKLNRQSALAIAAMAALAASAAWIPQAAAQTRGESEVYQTAGTGLTVDCSGNNGGTCHTLTGGESAVRVILADDTGSQQVSATYKFKNAAGTVLASGNFCNSTIVPVTPGSASLEVLVKALDVLTCLPKGVGVAVTGKTYITWDLSATGDQLQQADMTPHECLAAIPNPIPDNGQQVVLNTLVLLDGVSLARGQEVMSKAAQSYAPLGITLQPTFQQVSFSSTDAVNMINEARSFIGGSRPAGTDVVFTFTAKQEVTNLADCIGGIQYPERAFAVASDQPDFSLNWLESINIPNLPVTDFSSILAAHEIGHLLGGQHQLANCVEGTPAPNLCTVMSTNLVFFPFSFKFSTLNGTVVRNQAINFAAP